VERGRKEVAPREFGHFIPSSCLSLRRQGSFSLWRRDSGLWRSRQTTQASDQANVGSGPLAVRLFPSPFWPVKKGHPGGGYQQDGCRKAGVRVCFLPNHLVKSRREAERDGGQCDWPQLRQGGWCLRSWTGGRSGRTTGRCRVGPAPTEGAVPGPVRSLRIWRASRVPCHRCTGTASPFRIANRPFPHLQPSVSTNSQGSPGGDL
jgi:hypothetical protein